MTDHPQRFFEFDNFLLDSQQRLLFRDGEPLDLTPKVFDILLELVESGGRLVEKKELMESVWPDSFVEESNLTQHISTLRKKLGHDAGQQRYILTVPGRGYRFVTPVKSWDDDAIVTIQERTRSRVTIKNSGDAVNAAALPEIETSHRLLPATTARPFRPSRFLLVIVGLMLLGGIGTALLWWFRRPSVPSFSNIRLTRFTTDGTIDCAAVSPNGKYVAYVIADRGLQSLWIRQTATSNTGVVVVPAARAGYIGLTFSPDNDYIYYVSGPPNSPTALYRVPALGGRPVRLGEDVDSPPTFSPDGKRMAYLRGYPDKSESALLVAGADGSGETKIGSLAASGRQISLGPGPSWSPNGEVIACSVVLSDDTGQHQEVFVASVRSGEFKPLTHNKWFKVLRVAWTRDAKGLITTAADPDTANSQVWYVAYPSGEAKKITNDLSDYRGLTMTADSQVLAVVQADQQSNVWVASSDGAGAVQVTSTNYDGFDGLSWTPDGQVLYSTIRNGSKDLWLTDSQGKQKTQLTQGAGRNSLPIMSPDGRTIVFVSNRDGKEQLWKMDADGSHPQRLTDGDRDTFPVLSPGGQWIFYRAGIFGPPRIFKVSIFGGAPVPLTNKGVAGPPAISPDGKTLIFSYREPALSPVRLAYLSLAADGTSDGVLRGFEPKDTPRRGFLRWTNDGRAIAYLKTEVGVSNIWLQPFPEGTPRQLTNFDSEQIYNFAFSSDGRLAVTRGHESSDVVLIRSVN
jgi:eukaryotic-like serine/threonine-protein kinase